MKYKLAKKLKEVGFPQGVGDYLCKCGRKEPMSQPLECGCKEIVFNPTLSELIEACGEGFYQLERSISQGWIACGQNGIIVNGPTPEEAVANLWLELNKKLSTV